MQSTSTLNDTSPDHKLIPSDDELHAQAVQYINETNQLIFDELPKIISDVISQETWRSRNISFNNFGDYALTPAPEGLGISNNDMLWLLKSAMNKKKQHSSEWAEVLDEVDTHVRTYAKEKNIPIKDLSGNLTDYDTTNPNLIEEGIITYLPSRSNSNDGRLLKLKKKDPQAYEDVIQNKINLKDAWPQNPRKKLQPIEAVKNKFSSLSKSDREAFLAWIEEEKGNQ